MIYQLQKTDFLKVESLIKNSNHELSVKAVISGTCPGEIFVDNRENPQSVLIKTPECNLVAGKSDNKLFNKGVKDILEFFDPITCDDEAWEKCITEIHPNIALRKYVRRYYELDNLKYIDYMDHLDSPYILEYVTTDTLNQLEFENSEDIREWIKLEDIDSFRNYCLGSYIRNGNEIVSMSLVDCIVKDSVEIGIRTEKEYKKRGLGSIAAAATVSSCIAHGITNIGWHCVDTNIGSIKTAEKIGFRLKCKYSSFTPYPPIENDTDLTKEQWGEWATYYSEMNKIQPYYFWQAAVCWSKASEMEQTIENIMQLVKTDQMWFIDYMPDIDAFKAFEGNTEWEALISLINQPK